MKFSLSLLLIPSPFPQSLIRLTFVNKSKKYLDFMN